MAEGGDTTEESKQGTMSLRAVVIGGTGAVGKCLVGELLKSKNFSKVVVLGRRNTTVPESYNVDQSAAEKEGRLEQVTVDFETFTKETVGGHFQGGDVFFVTFGTTRASAGSGRAFVHIDHGYPLKCAEIAKDCGVSHMSVVTSQGANTNSMLLYLQTKGKIEEDSKKLNFKCLSIFRPGMLSRGNQARIMEKIAGIFMKPIGVWEVAKSMRVEAEQVAKNLSSEEDKAPEVKLYHNAEMRNMCKD